MSKARDLANAGTALTSVSATELGYVDGVTSAIQTQIDSKIGQSTAINPTIVDAKGDIITATAADTVARLAVGANDTVLIADSTAATGLKWGTIGAGAWSQVATGSLTGTSVSITGLSAKRFFIICQGWSHNDGDVNQRLSYRLNNDSGANYYAAQESSGQTSGSATGTLSLSSVYRTCFIIDLADTASQAKPIIILGGSSPVGGTYFSTSTITSFQVSPGFNATSFDAGTYYVWAFN